MEYIKYLVTREAGIKYVESVEMYHIAQKLKNKTYHTCIIHLYGSLMYTHLVDDTNDLVILASI